MGTQKVNPEGCRELSYYAGTEGIFKGFKIRL